MLHITCTYDTQLDTLFAGWNSIMKVTATTRRAIFHLPGFHVDGEHTVGAGTGHVHGRLADGPVGVPQKELQCTQIFADCAMVNVLLAVEM